MHIPDGRESEYCPNCGQYTEGEPICPNCGAVLPVEEESEGFHEEGTISDDDDL